MGSFHSRIVRLILSDVKLSVTVLVVLMAMCILRYYRSPWRKLPPGPPGLPLLGNILSLKEKQLWLTYTRWGKKYGPIMHLDMMGQPLIVLNTHRAAADLLERRAAISSDRPPNIVAVDMMTRGHLFVFAGATDLWKKMRKAAREALNNVLINKDHHPVFLKEAVTLASGLIENPTCWKQHIHRATVSAMAGMIYDKDPLESFEDPAVIWYQECFNRLLKAMRPGTHFVEFFTWMKHIPSCLATWKRTALESYKRDESVLRDLFESVRHQIAQGSERPSLTATLIRDQEKNQLSDIENIWAAATVYLGGDAPADILEWWMAAMITYPEIRRKAQQELDKIVGQERMPSFNDYEKLPYIRAMVKEILRWAPFGPVGVPHRFIHDDWYNDFFIPKHSIIIPNVWCMNRDPEVYGPDAHHFNPARYLDGNGQIAPSPPDTKEDGHVTFGYGRRACLGRQVANDSLFINIAVLLWAMDIECAIDMEGNPLPFDVTECVENGLIARPISFQCKITSRNPDTMLVLESAKENLL